MAYAEMLGRGEEERKALTLKSLTDAYAKADT